MNDITPLTLEEIQAEKRKVRDQLLFQKACDGDFAAFCEYCFADTDTGEAWTVYEYQKEWIKVMEERKKMVIWAPMQSGKCLWSDTVVDTLDGGYKLLKDVKAGDSLLSITEDGTLKPNKCVVSASTGKKEVYTIGLKDGHSLTCSGDHKILTGRGEERTYKRAAALSWGDYIVCLAPDGKSVWPSEFGWSRTIGERDTWDLQMADPYNNYVADGIVTHNSEFMSMAYPIWRLGRNPNENIISVSDTDKQALKWMNAGAEHIKENQRVREVFPNLKPAPHRSIPNRELKWGENGLQVERDRISGHLSWQCCGSFGSVLGSRATLILVDDAVDFDNSRTPERMQSLIHWVQSELLSRLYPTGQMIILGTTWAKGDLMHDFSARPTFFSIRYSVEKKDKKKPAGEMDGGTRHALRPGREKWLEEKKSELPVYEFDRQYRNQIRDTSNVTFPSVSRCFKFLPTDNMNAVHGEIPDVFAQADIITTGVDLSSKTRPGNAVITTAHRSTGTESHGQTAGKDVEHSVIGVEFGAWTSPETAQALLKTEGKYGVDYFTVEDNGYQKALQEWMEQTDESPMIKPFRTGNEKYDPHIGLPSLETEFANEKWSIYLPKHTENVIAERKPEDCECDYCRLAKELVFHPGFTSSDGVMALWFSRGRKHVKKDPKMAVYDVSKGKLQRPKAVLGSFYKENRLSASKNFQFPEDSDNIIQKWARFTPEEAEEELKRQKEQNSLDILTQEEYHNQNVLSSSEESLVHEMISFCKVLRGG